MVVHSLSFNRKIKDVRHTDCVLCKEKVSEWIGHTHSFQHIAFRSIGCHYSSLSPLKSRYLFECGVQNAFGFGSCVLAKEWHESDEKRRVALMDLIKTFFRSENFPKRLIDAGKTAVIGKQVLMRETIQLLYRMYPEWTALQVLSTAHAALSKNHILNVTDLLSLPRINNIEEIVGHLSQIKTNRSHEAVLVTLAKSAIARIAFELYNTFLWDSVEHLITVWDLYVDGQKELMEEIQTPKDAKNSPVSYNPLAYALPRGCLTHGIGNCEDWGKLLRFERRDIALHATLMPCKSPLKPKLYPTLSSIQKEPPQLKEPISMSQISWKSEYPLSV